MLNKKIIIADNLPTKVIHIIILFLGVIGLFIGWFFLWLIAVALWIIILPFIIGITFIRTFSVVTRYNGVILNPFEYIKWFVRFK